MSDENAKLVDEAKVKLSEAELRALSKDVVKKTLDMVNDWICEDIDRVPEEYNRNRVYAVYHRVSQLILNVNQQDEEVSEEEVGEMRRLRQWFSYHDIAFILRRSPSTVHEHLEDVLRHERLHQLIEATKKKAEHQANGEPES